MSRELALLFSKDQEEEAQLEATYPNLSAEERYRLKDRMRKARAARLGTRRERIERLVAQLELRIKELEFELQLTRVQLMAYEMK